MYSITVWHEGLSKYQVVRGRSEWEAKQKAELKKAAWNAQYARLQARDRKRQTHEDKRAEREAIKEEAAERAAEAEESTEGLRRVLVSIVEASPVFVIAKQKIASRFGESQPKPPNYHDYPREPKREDWTFVPEFNVFDKFFAFRRNKKVRVGREIAENGFLQDFAQWSEKCKNLQKANEEMHKNYEERIAKWQDLKLTWEANRDATNREIDAATVGLKNSDAESVYWLFENVWNSLPLPEDLLSGEYQIHFDEETKTLVIDLDLPEFEKTPNVKSVRYVASRNEIEEIPHKDSVVRALYDDFIYQLALGIPYAFFLCDSEQAVQAIVVNGWVTYINRASGNKTTACNRD
jgi:restriction system protein